MLGQILDKLAFVLTYWFTKIDEYSFPLPGRFTPS